MIGYPINKEDLEREIKYQEGIYKIMLNANAPGTAKHIQQHIEALKKQLLKLEDKD